jgi:hypothetical protein
VAEAGLPELAQVPWRRRETARRLRTRARLWTLTTVAHVVPFVVVAVVLFLIEPFSAPVGAIALAQAWIIPKLYAARGANTVKPKGDDHEHAEARAQGLLGDLLGHDARELQRATGLALEPGTLGTWLVAEKGALLVPPGGRIVHCFCVSAEADDLPPSDRVAHLLLALRTDEQGFATVANHAFAGAPWRVVRRLDKRMRPALKAAVRQAHGARGAGSLR